jgi:branched-chain amino acid transport system substrate-binding protein
MIRWIATFAAGLFVTWSSAALANPVLKTSDAAIRIGNVMPYTGTLAAFGAIGRAEAAYFQMLNERGGINGRNVEFISYDDSSDPLEAMDLTRNLIEAENALFVFGSFGTPSNLAVRKYLNDKHIPQLFVASGDDQWANPNDFPWTMGWPPAFRTEGRIYANYIQAYYSEKKIGVLWQNDQFGRDLFRGLEEGLGDAARMIVADTAFDATDRSLDPQLDILHNSGVEILVFDGAPTMAARVIRHLGETDWHPVLILDNAAASIANALRPGGLENSIGVISTAFLKDGSDPAWKDDGAMREYSSFMDKYYPEGDKEDSYAVFGYAVAQTLVQVLKQCGDDLSRENVMMQAQSLKDFRSSVTLPGIAITTSPTDFRPLKEMRLVQFDGRSWQPIGQLFDSAFTGGAGNAR